MCIRDRLKVIAVSGHRANVTTAEEAVKQLDVPGAAQKDVELTVYFVLGSDGPMGSAIPADLQSTVATLKSTFPFKNYGILDILSLRTRAGVAANTSGQLSQGRLTSFSVSSAALEGDGTMIQLNNPVSYTHLDVYKRQELAQPRAHPLTPAPYPPL